jgi:putative endonuclease
MSFYAYILKSESHQTYYYGSTEDLYIRLKEHNSGKVRYTKGRRPWILHYYEEYESRAGAVKREKFFKTVSGHIYLKGKRII